MLGHQSIRITERDRVLRGPPRKARYLRTSTAFEIGREVDGAEDNFRDDVVNLYIGRKVRRRLELCIEELTETWDKTIIDRTSDLQNWVELLRRVHERRIQILAFANNHFAGNGPATVKLFTQLWDKR